MKEVPTQPIAETITPLGTPKNGAKADRDDFKNRFRLKGLMVVGSFTLLIIGGGWLLYFLSKEPLLPAETKNSPLPANTVRSEITIETAPEPPPEVDLAQLQLE